MLGCTAVLSVSPVLADATSDIDIIVDQANAYYLRADYTEAELEMRKALATATSRLGAMHPATGGLSRRMAQMYLDQNRLTEAERYLRRALIIATGYGPVASTIEGDFIGVSIFINQSLQNPDSLTGSYVTADVLGAYSELFMRQGRYNDAVRLLQRVVKITEQGTANAASAYEYRADAKDLLSQALIRLGIAQTKQAHYQEAEETLNRAVSVTREAKGKYSAQSAAAVQALRRLYHAQGRSSDAQTLDEELENIRRNTR